MQPRSKSLHLLVVALLLTQCTPGGNLSKSQRQKLGSVFLTSGTLEDKAVQSPQAVTLESQQTIGFLSGFALGPVGGVIAYASINSKQKGFKEKNQSSVTKIEAGMPRDIAALVTGELKTRLKSDPFFSSRLTDQAGGAQLSVTVTQMTLLKVPDERGFSPSITAVATLSDATGTKLLKRFVMADGYGFNKKASVTDALAPLANYAADPALLRQHYLKVATVAAAALATELGLAAAQ